MVFIKDNFLLAISFNIYDSALSKNTLKESGSMKKNRYIKIAKIV